jgi:hypothetical protein
LFFEAGDVQGTDRQSQREAAVLAFDQKERAERIRAGKPQTRIGRSLEQFELGMTRARVEQLLPTGKRMLRRNIPDGLTVTLVGDSTDSGAAFASRQFFVRFDQANRVVEIRFRYCGEAEEHPDSGDWTADMLKAMTAKAGAPLEASPSWTRITADLPPQKPAAVLFTWRDDLTALSFQTDSSGVEVCLSDRTAGRSESAQLPALEYLPRGSGDCRLGMTQSELIQKWNIDKPVITGDGGWVLRPSAPRVYDAILVWFDHERVSRIVARYEPDNITRTTTAQWADAVTAAWYREISLLGWPRRHDLARSGVLQSLTWYDERTRVRTFWEETDDGSIRLLTEWKDVAEK